MQLISISDHSFRNTVGTGLQRDLLSQWNFLSISGGENYFRKAFGVNGGGRGRKGGMERARQGGRRYIKIAREDRQTDGKRDRGKGTDITPGINISRIFCETNQARFVAVRLWPFWFCKSVCSTMRCDRICN